MNDALYTQSEIDRIEKDFQDKRSKVLYYSLLSFTSAMVYQYFNIRKVFPNISLTLRIGVSLCTGVLSSGISYLVLINLYEI